MKRTAIAAIVAVMAQSGMAQQDCRDVGPTHPNYPDYKASQCFVTIGARPVGVSVLGGTRTAWISEHADIPHPCNSREDDEEGPIAFTVNNNAVWKMLNDAYHNAGQGATVTFDVRRNVIVEDEDGNIDTRHTQCRGIIGAAFPPDDV